MTTQVRLLGMRQLITDFVVRIDLLSGPISQAAAQLYSENSW